MIFTIAMAVFFICVLIILFLMFLDHYTHVNEILLGVVVVLLIIAAVVMLGSLLYALTGWTWEHLP